MPVFPLKLEESLSRKIDNAVYVTNAYSKHQYILDAINDKLVKDIENRSKISEELKLDAIRG